jgi:hypothetical protein
MENFDLRKYLAESKLIKENFGVNLDTPENAASFKDYLAQNGISAEVDGVWVELNGGAADIQKIGVLRDKFLGTSQTNSPFGDNPSPSDFIEMAVDKAYYDEMAGEFTLTPTDIVVTKDNFETIIYDEVGDEEVDFNTYAINYPNIFKAI